MFVPRQWAHYVAYICLYTAFDVWGFRDVDQRRGSPEYRILQKMFALSIFTVIYFLDGWWTVGACVVASYFLVCDVLYYWAVDVKLGEFTWFVESPVNFLFNVLLKKPTPVWAVVTSAAIGFSTGLYITMRGIL